MWTINILYNIGWGIILVIFTLTVLTKHNTLTNNNNNNNNSTSRQHSDICIYLYSQTHTLETHVCFYIIIKIINTCRQSCCIWCCLRYIHGENMAKKIFVKFTFEINVVLTCQINTVKCIVRLNFKLEHWSNIYGNYSLMRIFRVNLNYTRSLCLKKTNAS